MKIKGKMFISKGHAKMFKIIITLKLIIDLSICYTVSVILSPTQTYNIKKGLQFHKGLNV